MASTPPHGSSSGDPSSGQKWTGRARVSAPVPTRSTPPPVYGSPRTPVTPPPRQNPVTRPGRRPRWGRILLVALAVLVLIAGAGLVSSYLWVKNVDNDLKRTDPFAQLTGRPQKLADGTLNILLVGSDSRAEDPSIGERSDTLVIMHIPASHDQAYLTSIPRDTWVHVPLSADGQNGDTMAKINAAYAWGGLPLTVQTVEEYTGVRMDHVAVIDFAGFVQVVDALGGVDMNVEQTITSIHPPYRVFQAGPNTFNGDEALDYVRQRYQFPDGDFARMRHQQEFLKAVLDKAVSKGTVTNLGTFKDFVSSVASAMTVDKDFSLIDLGWQFHSLRSDNLTFIISPNLGSDTIDGQSVVVSDRENASGYYDAMAHDTLTEWLAQHPNVNPGG
jgi:LCP family protein required for cell wall assembly